jgi:diphthamide biosynthesis protein 3
MASYYDEVEVRALCTNTTMKNKRLIIKQIEDMDFDEENLIFHSPCPCGDRFEISLVSSNFVLYHLSDANAVGQAQLKEGEDIARCPSCSLIIRVIYDPVCSIDGNELTCKDDFKDDDDEKEKLEVTNLTVEVTA